MIGEIGAKAFSSKEDHDVYEAIRQLSIVKEDVSSTEEQLRQAEAELERVVKAVAQTSEAALVSRLYWWTVEYGLIGSVDHPIIYGAGLLSSVAESVSCLQPDVQKIPFRLEECIATDYDITKPQPQLFVCKDFHELMDAAKELGTRLAYHIGGTYSLQQASESANTATVVYSSGLQVTGTLSEIEYDDRQEAVYFKMKGPSALAYDDCELLGHSKDYHYEGFGSPVGLLKDMATPMEDMSEEQLQELGIVPGQKTLLPFASGVRVEGVVKEVLRIANRTALISFDDCMVTYGGKTLFQSEWGPYDMAVGAAIVSAYPGAADKERFATGTHQPSELKTKRPAPTPEEQRRNMMYRTIRDVRENQLGFTKEEVGDVVECTNKRLNQYFPKDWLLRLELVELMAEQGVALHLEEQVRADLKRLSDENSELKPLIENGLALIAD
jgi:phenylalanine-4-hydroxylase